MFKEMGKIREIKGTLDAYGEVKEGDDYFQTTKKLRKELGVLQGSVRKQALGALVLVVLGGSAVWHYLTKSGEEEAHDKSVATAPSSPGPNSGAGQDARADYPEGKKDFHYDLQDRIIDLLKRFLPQDQVAKNLNQITGDPDYILIESVVVSWVAELARVTSKIPREYEGKFLYNFFKQGALPSTKDLPVTVSSFLESSQFFVGRVEEIGKSEKRSWFNEHRIPYYDKEFKFLALPKIIGSEAELEDLELVLFAIKDCAMEHKAITGGNGETSDFAKKVLGPLLDESFFLNGLGRGEAGFWDYLLRLKQEGLACDQEKEKLTQEEKNKKIEKALYLWVRAFESMPDKRLDGIRPFLRKIIENPQEYLDLAAKDPELNIEVLRKIVLDKRSDVVERTYGPEEAKGDSVENGLLNKDFVEHALVPTLRGLKLKSVDDYDLSLAKFFQKGAVMAAVKDRPYKMADTEFFVSDLDDKSANPKGVWMGIHQIPYFDEATRTLFLPKYPDADQVEDIFYCLKDMNEDKGKNGLLASHKGALEVAKGGKDELVKAITKIFEINNGLYALGESGIAGILKSWARDILNERLAAGENLNQEADKAVEAEAYRLVIYLLNIDDPKLKIVLPVLKAMQERPNLLSLSDKEKSEHPDFYR